MENLLVTVSGGKTSAYMAMLIESRMSEKYNILYIFANTGQEHEKTLEFVDKVGKTLGLDLVWVEAVVHGDRIASTAKVVDFDSASRSGEPFKSVIEKYGIPNKAYPHCNREMKLNPIHDCAKHYFNGEKYKTAIGIRIDETRRVSKNAESAHSDGIIYPLIDWWPTDKMDVNDWWEDQDFNLDIPEHYGNCVTCWKKSDRKLFTIITEEPERFDFFREMELLHPHSGHNDGERKRVFFRKNRSTNDMFAECDVADFKRFVESSGGQLKLFGYDLDADGGCSESCELYEMESVN
jgi:hypothetical protein